MITWDTDIPKNSNVVKCRDEKRWGVDDTKTTRFDRAAGIIPEAVGQFAGQISFLTAILSVLVSAFRISLLGRHQRYISSQHVPWITVDRGFTAEYQH